jgi:protein SCO1/2
MAKTQTYAVAAAVAVIGVLGATMYFATRPAADDPFAPCREAVIAGGPGSIGGPFTLVDETGKTVTDKDVFKKPSLVYFGYTFCPDVCPADTARNAEAVDAVAKMGYDVQPIFISIDPERDTPEVLAEFTDYLHEDMLGLTGSSEQVKAASQAYKTYFRKQDGDPEYYLVDHSTFSYLVLPDTGFVEFFKRDMTAEDLAKKMACYLDIAGYGN